jgi:predicted kinase
MPTMNETLLIIITGAPGTGKTTLGQKLAKDFKLPFISKDGIKEVLFDSLGYKDIPGGDEDAWQKKLGVGAIESMHHINERLTESGYSHILESNFVPQFANERFVELQKQYPVRYFQIYCYTQPEVLLKRFQSRLESGTRHPGHADHTFGEQLRRSLESNKYGKLDIPCELHEIDTTDLTALDHTDLYNKLKEVLN